MHRNESISLKRGYKDFINFIMDFCDSKFKKQKKIREEEEKGESWKENSQRILENQNRTKLLKY